MSEIEKLMQNSGVKPDIEYWCKRFDETRIADCNGIKNSQIECAKCENGYIKEKFYPEFTAEKQLSLIKWLAITRAILIKQNRMFVGFETGNPKDLKCAEDLDLNFEETLAKLINHLWQSLTDTEKAEIKRILE